MGMAQHSDVVREETHPHICECGAIIAQVPVGFKGAFSNKALDQTTVKCGKCGKVQTVEHLHGRPITLV
jgi:hypothetical protein